MENIEFRDLSIADLIALHTNYWLTKKIQPGARFELVSEWQFQYIEAAIKIKIDLIQFPSPVYQIKQKTT